jgi:hypothetical protein
VKYSWKENRYMEGKEHDDVYVEFSVLVMFLVASRMLPYSLVITKTTSVTIDRQLVIWLVSRLISAISRLPRVGIDATKGRCSVNC